MSRRTAPVGAPVTLALAALLATAGPAAGQTIEYDEVAMLPGPADLVELDGRRA